MTITVTLLGTGSPIPSPNRAGPATLISAGSEKYLVDTGRGVLMRLAGALVGIGELDGVLLTHLHSDHITDLNDVITSYWILGPPDETLTIVGPPGTQDVVDAILASLSRDVKYRMDHHDDLNLPPLLNVIDVAEGVVSLGGNVAIECAPTDHKPVEPTIGYRFTYEEVSVVAAGDTLPCAGLDSLCDNSDALVHTVIRKDLVKLSPNLRAQDILDYHSSPEEAAQTAQKGGMSTLIMTHYVPDLSMTSPAADGQDWIDLAAQHFSGQIEVGDDLHRVEITKGE